MIIDNIIEISLGISIDDLFDLLQLVQYLKYIPAARHAHST